MDQNNKKTHSEECVFYKSVVKSKIKLQSSRGREGCSMHKLLPVHHRR